MEDLTDAELVSRCRDGDDRAWEALVDRYSRYIYSITTQAFRLPQHEAEDVFQEVFIRAFEKLGTLRDDSAVKPWLAQMTRRLSIDRIRASGRVVVTDEPPEQDVDDEILRLDEALGVQGALATLPEHCQEIIDRFFARDESYRTIAEEMDVPPGTIASRISRCLAKLKTELEDSPDEGREPASTPSI